MVQPALTSSYPPHPAFKQEWVQEKRDCAADCTRQHAQPYDLAILKHQSIGWTGPSGRGSFEGAEGVAGDDSKHNVGRLCRIQAQVARLGPETLPFLFQAFSGGRCGTMFPTCCVARGLAVRQVIGAPPARLPACRLQGWARLCGCPGAQVPRWGGAEEPGLASLLGGALKVPC